MAGTVKVRIIAPAVANAVGIEGAEGIVDAPSDVVDEAVALGGVERVGKAAPAEEAPAEEEKPPRKKPGPKPGSKRAVKT